MKLSTFGKISLKSRLAFFAGVVLVFGLFAVVLGTQQRQDNRSRASGAVTVNPPATIISDCSVDVTIQLNDWIKTVPDNSILEFSATACYRIDKPLEFFERNNITIEGNGATFKAGTDGREAVDPRTRQHIRFTGGSNITVRNIIVRGAHPNGGTSDAAYVATLEAQHGIQIVGVQTALLENVQIYDVYGDFIYIAPRKNNPRIFATDITIRNSRFERNGRQGIALSGAKNILIENNFISHTRRATVDIEPNFVTDGVSFFTFKNNQVGPGRLLFFAHHGAAAPMSDITFEGNTLTGRTLNSSIETPSTSSVRRQRYKFINNTSNTRSGSPAAHVIRFVRVDDIEVRGNTQPVDNWRPMHIMSIKEASNVKAIDNKIPGALASIKMPDPTTVTDYCTANNIIGNPQYVEYTSYTCPGYPTGAPAPTTPLAVTPMPTNIPTPTNTPTPTPIQTDVTSPSIAIVSPSNGSIITRGKSNSIAANASDNASVTKVEFYVNGALMCTDTTAFYICSWNVPKSNNKTYTIKAKAYDGAGNTAESSVTVRSN